MKSRLQVEAELAKHLQEKADKNSEKLLISLKRERQKQSRYEKKLKRKIFAIEDALRILSDG